MIVVSGSTAPVGSFTCPRIAPFAEVWATAGSAERAIARTTDADRASGALVDCAQSTNLSAKRSTLNDELFIAAPLGLSTCSDVLAAAAKACPQGPDRGRPSDDTADRAANDSSGRGMRGGQTLDAARRGPRDRLMGGVSDVRLWSRPKSRCGTCPCRRGWRRARARGLAALGRDRRSLHAKRSASVTITRTGKPSMVSDRPRRNRLARLRT